METILTNEWMPASGPKWRGRLCLVRSDKGYLYVAKWNGMYWVNQHDSRMDHNVTITHFYVFEKAPKIIKD